MSILDKIGSLRRRLQERVGRSFGHCDECGKPTRSHVIDGQYHCHQCYSGGNVVLADGGTDDADSERFYRDEVDFSNVETGVFPESVTEYDAWMPWRYNDEGRKTPTSQAYYDGDNPGSWSNPETLTDFETAKKWADMDPRYEGAMYMIQDESEPGHHADFSDPFIFVDYDDARDAETGEMSAYAKSFMDRVGATYTDISVSGTGAHQIGIGSLPDGVTALDFEFPDGSEVEVYDRRRPCAFTGKHVEGTPKEVRPINQNAIALAAAFHGGFSTSKTKAGGEDWEPEIDREELAEIDAVDNLETINDAIEQVRPRDIRLKSKKTGERADGTLDFDPSWEHSESGTRLGWDPEIGWIYRKGSTGLNALQVVALEEGIVQRVGDYPSGEDWFEAVDALRDRGAHIPEFKRPGGGATRDSYPGKDEGHEYDPGYVSTLPETRRTRAIGSGWDWTNNDDAVISKDEIHQRVEDRLHNIMDHGRNAVLDAPMSSGKTYSTFKTTAERDEPMAYACARHDMYEEAAENAERFGQQHYVLPSVHRHCPVFRGEYGEDLRRRVEDKYEHGATPQTIHEDMNLPCNDDGCEYRARCEFDPDNYDVLIGHYAHLNLTHFVAGRQTFVDEDPGDALTETIAGEHLERTINAFLTRYDFPAEDYTDLMERRRTPELVEGAHEWFEDFDWEPDEEGVMAMDGYHAMTPHAVYVLVFGEPVDSNNTNYPFERAVIPSEQREIGVFEHSSEHSPKKVILQAPPRTFSYARSVIGLDGTAYLPEWERALGLDLDHREVLSSVEEKRSYYHDTLGIEVFQASEHTKPYSSGNYVTLDRDRNLVERINEKVKSPVVVSSKKAIEQYEEDGWDEPDGPAAALDNFSNLRGSNRYADEECALVNGSPNYGHRWVKRQAAMEGTAVYPDGKGDDLDYGDAEEIARQMREAVILQTVLRFGRDEDTNAVVFLNTNVVPDELRISGRARVQHTHTENQRDIWRACEQLAEIQGGISPVDVYEHPDVDCSKRTVEKTMKKFHRDGAFSARDEQGRRVVYAGWDDEPHHLSEHGVVELPAIDGDSEDSHTVYYVPTFGVLPADDRECRVAAADDTAPEGSVRADAAEDGPPPG